MDHADSPFDLRLEFRRGGAFLGASALALPSGLVIMTDELVKLAQDDDELVAVMAHEVGHIVHRHGLRQVIQHSALGLVMSYLTGDVSSIVAMLPLVLVQQGYSRDFEREADAYALNYLLAEGLSPRHFVHIMQRLEEKAGRETNAFSHYLSTHPPTSERVQPFVEAAER